MTKSNSRILKPGGAAAYIFPIENAIPQTLVKKLVKASLKDMKGLAK